MTTSQIMTRLREIQIDLDAVKAHGRSGERVQQAWETLNSLIEQMLADEQRAREAHTMGELPFDGRKVNEQLYYYPIDEIPIPSCAALAKRGKP